MELGCKGRALTDTINVLGVLLPQPLLAVTEIVPPELPTVAVIEFEVELPDHPEGNAHV